MAFEIGDFATKLSSGRPRTIEVVTEEAKEAVAQIATGFMDLGARLTEAKEMLPHGEWLPWLEREMHFSERTAQKYMALAREYEGNPQLASDLGSEKAFALLALPMEEREEIAAHGATVNGKTKAPADLTTRDVKQIVAERKAPFDARQEVADYLAAREAEDQRFQSMLRELLPKFSKRLSFFEKRQDGIGALKESFSNAGGAGGTLDWFGSAKGLRLRELHYGGGISSVSAPIERTWTEVWDMLAVMALQEAGRKPEEPEGQLTIAGYMPGGTNPGRESGLCVCIMDLGGPEPVAKLLYWDGLLGQWLFRKNGERANLEPLGWMRLPEWRG